MRWILRWPQTLWLGLTEKDSSEFMQETQFIIKEEEEEKEKEILNVHKYALGVSISIISHNTLRHCK